VRRLAGAVELLDGPLDDPAALRGNLRDLRLINRYLGGVELSRWALTTIADAASLAAGSALRVVDVGAGGADIPLALHRSWHASAATPQFTAVDSRPEVLAAAHEELPGLAGSVAYVLADGRSLPFDDAAFDVGHASLVLHHLEPVDAVGLLRELARVARLGIVVNDLDRAAAYWLGARLMGAVLTRNPLTRNDAPLSVRRAYTVREMGDLLRVAGMRPVAVRRAVPGYRYAIVAVPAGRR
jgi:SAM-dependent methyltransferase